MATGVWTNGYTCPVKFTLSGGSEITLQVTDHSWREMVDSIDITHTGSGGIQALLAGIFRGDGSVTAFQDTTGSGTKFYATTVGVRAGAKGVLKHYITSALFYTIPCMITEVTSQSPVAGGVSYSFNVSLDSESGTFTYPS
jgi:hypothetical protein